MGGSSGTAKTSVADAQSLLDGKTAVTFTGWYQSDSNIASLARLIDQADSTVVSSQWSLFFDGDVNKLQFNIGGTPFVSNAGFGLNQQWVFFAVTFNAGDKVQFFVGEETSAAAAAGSISTTLTDLGSNSKPLTLSNRDNAGRAFDGFLYDIRVYDQVLNAAQIESVRASGIPEPMSALLLSAGALTLFKRRNRR